MANYSYFKFRKRFDFNAHPYELGSFMVFNRKIESNFFFNKLFYIQENEHISFFNFHEKDFLLKHPGEEKQFLKHVLEEVQDRIEYYKRIDVYKDAERTLLNLSILKSFKNTLDEIDIWNLNKSYEILLAEKDIEIASHKQEIELLKGKLKTATKYDADIKIRLNNGTLPVLIDLIQQIQDLTLPDDRKFCTTQTSQSPWYKMIAKYFQNGEKEISIETVRNYFPVNKEGTNIKGSKVAKSDHLFIIKPIRPLKP